VVLNPALAASGVSSAAADAPDSSFELYLRDRELRSVLAAYWHSSLESASPADKAEIARKLGRLYVQMLSAASTPDERRSLEAAGRRLLEQVPGAEPLDLKLDLARVTYLKAEQLLEDHRVRLATPEQVGEAQRILRNVGPIFESVAARAHQRVEQLERVEKSGRESETAEFRAELADARRLRSLARYYRAWAEYYLAYATGDLTLASEAVNDFGWLLGTGGGRPASVERMAKGLLRYPHVARAAVGCALCASLRGNDVEAVRWLDAVEESTEITDDLVAELPERKIVVLGAARRWSDLDVLVKRIRLSAKDGAPQLLSPRQARLVAVIGLEAAMDPVTRTRAGDIVQEVAKSGLADLVAHGEVGHVLNLVTQFGTEALGDKGFLVFYARGLQSLDRARQSHTQAGGTPDVPAQDSGTINRYREAARLLDEALKSDDTARFAKDAADASIKRGLALYGAGDLEESATVFASLLDKVPTPAQNKDALWYAIVSLDRAVELGKLSLQQERDRLAVLYIERFPGTVEAAKLLLRRAGAGRLPDTQVVETLLAVPADSPLYLASRGEASRILYLIFRRSRADRDFAAVRFADVAEPLLQSDRTAALETKDRAEAARAAEQTILRVRQLCDALLSSSSPDIKRAERALEVYDELKARLGMTTPQIDEEIAYRRLQIAVISGDFAEVERKADALRAGTGPFARAGLRLVLSRAAERFTAAPEDLNAARRVLIYSERVLPELDAADPKLADGSHVSVLNTTAEAAAAVWRLDKDTASRDRAIVIDRRLFDAGKHSRKTLRRLAELSEAAADRPTALEAWRTLAAGTEPATPDWYEARYNAIRVLSMIDPPRAREALDQHRILYPTLGPEPWDAKFAELDGQVPRVPPANPASAQPNPGTPPK
jgi:tetratricopeptide (TPR) repeat protein